MLSNDNVLKYSYSKLLILQIYRHIYKQGDAMLIINDIVNRIDI